MCVYLRSFIGHSLFCSGGVITCLVISKLSSKALGIQASDRGQPNINPFVCFENVFGTTGCG